MRDRAFAQTNGKRIGRNTKLVRQYDIKSIGRGSERIAKCSV
jgi:hypothetical protein